MSLKEVDTEGMPTVTISSWSLVLPPVKSRNEYWDINCPLLNAANSKRMIKRRANAAGLCPSTCCHTFRATGITTHMSNGGPLEKAKEIAGHEFLRTTELYDRTDKKITLEDVERIRI
jgi:hypothetical protein